MPRLNSTNWSTGDNISATRLQQINADLDDLYSKGSDRLKVYAATGLNITIGAGVFRVGSTEGIYAGGTVAMTDNATNYVQIDSSGTIQVSTSAWNADYTKLAVVTTVSGAITAIVVWRIDAIGGVLGGGISLIASGVVTPGLTTGTFTADHTTETFTSTAHGLQNGDKITIASTTSVPTGMAGANSTEYYVRDRTANTFKVSAAGPYQTVLAISDNGVGTLTWTFVASSINLSFVAKKHLKIVIYTGVPTASSILRMVVNGDGAANYGTRQSSNGAADSANNGQSAFTELAGIVGGSAKYSYIEIFNIASVRKQGHFNGGTDNNSTTTAPNTCHGNIVWNNTTDQITSLTAYVNGLAGMGTGAFVDVYGMD